MRSHWIAKYATIFALTGSLLLAPAVRAADATPAAAPTAGPQAVPIELWPGVAPGEKGDIGPERDTTKPDSKVPPEKYVTRIGNVSKPTLTLFAPSADKANGASVVVCPGGGYSILAYDLEGTEICKWLNSVGVTGVLLKYRVPSRKGLEKQTAALQDVQRAIGLVRLHSKEWALDPERIGVMGFSAGGHLSAAVSTNFANRTYPSVDEADKLSCRPNFAMLIYPAYLADKTDLQKLAADLPVTRETPPTFIAMTQDDPIKVEGALAYLLALKAAKVQGELHVYPTGGHGYGMRPSQHAVTTWPARAAEWMQTSGWLKRS